MNTPFPLLITPWQCDFLESVLQNALDATHGDISRAAFLFPHSRPQKYLERMLRHDARIHRPLLLPQFHTVSSLFSQLRKNTLSAPAWNAGMLDRVGLLLQCVRDEAAASSASSVDAPTEKLLTSAKDFFPWGVRLASLYEECFTQYKKPENFQYMEGQVTPFAAALLERLGTIFKRYVAELEHRSWTTPGYDAFRATDYIVTNGSLPGVSFANQHLTIGGFHALTDTENTLFHHLWKEQNAQVMLHADPAILTGTAHWSCEALTEWATRWKTHLACAPGYESFLPTTDASMSTEQNNEATYRFYEGFDLHSQLTVLEKELAETPPTTKKTEENSVTAKVETVSTNANDIAKTPPLQENEDVPLLSGFAADTAVVLPDSGLLMPTLHHLPHTDINVSMGYPLSRSPLFRLLDTIIRLQENRRGNGYYWRDLVELLRHPYVKMLHPEENADEETSTAPTQEQSDSLATRFRRELHRLEQRLREYGRKYPEPRDLIEQTYVMLAPEEMPPRPVLLLLDTLLQTTLAGFSSPQTPNDVGKALEGLCSLLLTRGKHLWDRFLIDAECLYRLMQSLIPELCHSQLAHEPLPPATLFAMLRQLMEAERVPFDATPLVGLQVMGMLETRLLTFRRVVFVDATEDKLPGSPVGDPLLPEALRHEVGLPAMHTREQVTAYHFFRLLAGAKEVVLLWQEAPDTPGIQERKKKKTRFVEELLWQQEKRLGRLLATKGQDGSLTVLSSSISPIPKERQGVTVTPAIRHRVRELLRQPISASLLDAYLRCPLRFFYERVARLAPADAIPEGDDPLAVGNLFHTALQDFYTPYLYTPLAAGQNLAPAMRDELMAIVRSSPDFMELSRKLPADSFAMLRAAGRERLSHYLLNQPATTVLALETTLAVPFTTDTCSLTLTGNADRIDMRFLGDPSMENDADNGVPENGITILDYKTGHIPTIKADIWDDAELWHRIQTWQPRGLMPTGSHVTGQDAHLLPTLAARMESVQLPFYLLLYARAQQQRLLPEKLLTETKLPVHNALWVSLGTKGEEIPLFPKTFSAEKRADIITIRIPQLVDFLTRHILETPVFLPQPGNYCDWCFCGKLCMLSCNMME